MRTPPYLLLLLLSSCSAQEFVVGGSDELVEPFNVAGLHAEWATPTQIRWAWDSSGRPTTFDGFRLVLAPTRAEVEQTAASCRIITAAENVELADWFLPGSDGPARSSGTTSSGHPQASAWFARLEWSSDGEPAFSDVASASTGQAPTGQLVVFHDSAPAPYTIPDTFVLGSAGPHAGTSDYEYRSDCAGADACWENLRFSQMDFDLSSVPETALDRAGYLEFALAYQGSSASYWSELFVQFTGCAPCRFGFPGWAVPADDQYHVYQVPLSALKRDGQAISISDFQSGLDELRIGGRWAQGGFVRVDEISLYW